MTDRFSDQSPRSTARIAGFLYFMYIAASVVADLLGHFAFGDSAAIISTIAAHPALFRAGLVIGLLLVCFPSPGGLGSVRPAEAPRSTRTSRCCSCC